MKIAILAAALALALAATATAATTAPPADVMAAQINTLKRQVSGLTLQVTSLRGQVASARTEAAQAVTAATANRTDLQKFGSILACQTAIMADGFHITWKVIDIVVGAFGAAPVFGYQAPLDDHGACAAVGITRTPQGVSVTGRAWMAAPLLNAALRVAR